MAKIYTDNVLIQVSRLAKDEEDQPKIIHDDILANIEEVVGELVDTPNTVIEVIRVNDDA